MTLVVVGKDVVVVLLVVVFVVMVVDFVVVGLEVCFVVVDLVVCFDVVLMVVVVVDVEEDKSNLKYECKEFLIFLQVLLASRCERHIIQSNVSQAFVTNRSFPDQFVLAFCPNLNIDVNSSSFPLVEVNSILLSSSFLLPYLSKI